MNDRQDGYYKLPTDDARLKKTNEEEEESEDEEDEDRPEAEMTSFFQRGKFKLDVDNK